MCLIIDTDVTIDFNENNEVIAYKVFRKHSDNEFIYSFYQETVAKENYIADKIIIEDGIYTEKPRYVHNAIHVFLLKPEIEKEFMLSRDCLFVECICKKEDLVATGLFGYENYKSAAFTKVKLIPPVGYYTDKNGYIKKKKILTKYWEFFKKAICYYVN